VQAELQQKPSTQLPLVHCASREHAVPTARSATHLAGFCVVSQKPPAQSVSRAHELEHAVPEELQVNGLQLWVAGMAPHVPEPSQVAGGWYVFEVQDAVEQVVPAGSAVLHAPDLHTS